ncbi:MAG: polysaccharide deacetylase family protein [Butyricicoccus sp.]
MFVIAACAAAVLQTRRLEDAGVQMEALEKQVSDLQKQLDEMNAVVPQALLEQAVSGQALDYQKLYPEMKAEATTFAENDPKAVYLTFDDGPSANTEKILDALKEKNQKATFFVVGKNIAGREAVLGRIVDEGHTIGIHGFSHNYDATYASIDAFLEDFHQAYEAVYQACGVYPTVFRFPGGSVNAYNRATYQQIIAEMVRRGFVYYDWNVSSEDATGKAYTAEQLVQTVMAAMPGEEHAIVLMHDAADKKATADAVPLLIDQLMAQGYYCDKLTPTVQPVTFSYNG